MEPELILVQSSECRKDIVFGELCLWIDLPAHYQFKDKTGVRLHSVAGITGDLYVFVSFARSIPFGKTFKRAVGLTKSLPGPWTQVEGNYISNLATVRLGRVSGRPFVDVPKKPFALLFELSNGGPKGDHRV